ncbi:hypothetical protein BJX70DRAFT_398947 [Aspergillus crustosus]
MHLTVTGNITDLPYDSLAIVRDALVVSNERATVPAETSMDLSFPVLDSSTTLSITGKALSISLPELTTLISASPIWTRSNFSLWGEDASIDLPKLHTVDGSINFEGDMTSVDLPGLPIYQIMRVNSDFAIDYDVFLEKHHLYAVTAELSCVAGDEPVEEDEDEHEHEDMTTMTMTITPAARMTILVQMTKTIPLAVKKTRVRMMITGLLWCFQEKPRLCR